MNFPHILATLRRQRGLSQLELSGLSGVSQRHISFLETGRASPGSAALEKISVALDLDYEAMNALYRAGRLGPPHAGQALELEEFSAGHAALSSVLRLQEPCPAIITSPSGYILESNRSFGRILSAGLGETALDEIDVLGDGRNLYILTFHPEGLPRLLVNPEAVLPHVWQRLCTAAAVNPEAARVAEICRQFHAPDQDNVAVEPAAIGGAVIERYLVNGLELNLVTMSAAFGSPVGILARSMSVEIFLPIDEQSETNIHRLAK